MVGSILNCVNTIVLQQNYRFCKQEQISVGNTLLLKNFFLDVCWRVSKGSRPCIHLGESYFQSCGVLQNIDFNSVHVLTLTLNHKVQEKIVKVIRVWVLPCHEPTPSWKMADLFFWAGGRGFGHWGMVSVLLLLCAAADLAHSHYLSLHTGSISIQKN